MTKWTNLWSVLLLLLALAVTPVFTGCGNDDDDDDDTSANDDDTANDDDDTEPQCAEGTVAVDGACVPDIDEGWTQIFPGGDTICSRGTEFSYWVRKGTVNKLVVGIDGGGACWSSLTCSTANPTFSPEADDDPRMMNQGFFDFENPKNPFGDWYMILVPYCTGDIHWGNNVHTYEPLNEGGEPIVINHKGFVNATAVMDYMYDHFSNPEKMLVTGVSAGSYGSLMYSAYLMDHYEQTEVIQLGDAGAGVVTGSFIETGFNNWGALENVPDYLTGIKSTPVEELDLSDLYIELAENFPQHMLSQYNALYDWNQEFYYTAMGGDEADWSAGMVANQEKIAAAVPNFAYWIQGGEQHGILPYPELYTYAVDGEPLVDWILDLVNGEDVPNVMCTENCEEAETLE